MNALLFARLTLARLRVSGDREGMRIYRGRRVAELIAHAYRHVPYYRRRMEEAGLRPSDLRSEEDLRAMPVSDKNALRKAGNDIFSDAYRANCLPSKFTSGSSGEPIRIRRTFPERVTGSLIQRRMLATYGAAGRMRTAAISMHGAAPRPGGRAGAWAAMSDIIQGTRINLDCRRDPLELVDALERFRPDIVLGYAGTLAMMGEQLLARGPLQHTPRMVLSGSETLTPERRRMIRDGFGVPVYDYYAALETGVIAWECPTTGLYHLADDHVVLHVERDGRPVAAADGARGEAIVTNLHAYAMPFIRYRLGDALVMGPDTCPCGAPFATLRSIEGRWMDHFVMPDGGRLHPMGIAGEFVLDEPRIRQYQMIQESVDRIVVHAVVSEPDDRLRRFIEQRITDYCGAGVHVHVKWVDHIEPDASGKYKLFVSRVA